MRKKQSSIEKVEDLEQDIGVEEESVMSSSARVAEVIILSKTIVSTISESSWNRYIAFCSSE